MLSGLKTNLTGGLGTEILEMNSISPKFLVSGEPEITGLYHADAGISQPGPPQLPEMAASTHVSLGALLAPEPTRFSLLKIDPFIHIAKRNHMYRLSCNLLLNLKICHKQSHVISDSPTLLF